MPLNSFYFPPTIVEKIENTENGYFCTFVLAYVT